MDCAVLEGETPSLASRSTGVNADADGSASTQEFKQEGGEHMSIMHLAANVDVIDCPAVGSALANVP